ncbi:hypothetical protein Lal_00039609 [Lupinus albus]|nr:hypothetical protein Lal_00039609 [Lupinus albus]
MRFFRDPVDMIYKHRIDHQIASSKNPFVDPPTQQHSSFPIESSSSTSMPSNQMIMDQLFSLRDYIITLIDTFDVANQQVQWLTFIIVPDEFTVGRSGPRLGMLNDACNHM